MGQSEPEDKGVCLHGRAYGQIYTHQVKAPLAKKCSTNRLRKSLLLAKTWSCTQIVFHHVVRAAIWLKGCPQKCRDCEVPNLDSVWVFFVCFLSWAFPFRSTIEHEAVLDSSVRAHVRSQECIC